MFKHGSQKAALLLLFCFCLGYSFKILVISHTSLTLTPSAEQQQHLPIKGRKAEASQTLSETSSSPFQKGKIRLLHIATNKFFQKNFDLSISDKAILSLMPKNQNRPSQENRPPILPPPRSLLS